MKKLVLIAPVAMLAAAAARSQTEVPEPAPVPPPRVVRVLPPRGAETSHVFHLKDGGTVTVKLRGSLRRDDMQRVIEELRVMTDALPE